MSTRRLDTNLHTGGDRHPASLLSPVAYDDDAASIHSRSDQDTDSDDDELQMRARNSRELRAADRLVFMEEEEVDKLVTDTRKRRESGRRGSNLPLPNPLKLFRRASETRASSSNSSTDNIVSEKRRHRRARRKEKKTRLLEEATHGEDGGLMYEMEEGGMKEGSTTGDSSDRDDSDEIDRRHLKMVADAKGKRGRHWRRWLFIHTMIIVGFAILVLAAWKLSLDRKSRTPSAQWLSNGTALFAPTTIIISLDGFRADFLQRDITPRLNAFIKEGVSPKYMLPAFPSVTFPNHYTLATGLHPESHGVVGNTFWDPELLAEFYYTDPGRSMDPKWWHGEPFWVTAEKNGIRTAIHMWPGSEAHIGGVEPAFLDKYNGKEPLSKKVARVFEFLDKPGMEVESANVQDMRPQLIAAYVPNVDGMGHKYGPNSTEMRTTIAAADNMLDQIFQGLEDRNLTNIVNVIVVSDHGMATTDTTRLMQLEDLVDMSKIERTDGWPLYGLRPKNLDDLQSLYDGLAEKSKTNPNFEVYLRDVNMPERYHFSNNPRISPLWIIPKTGWAIVKKEELVVSAALEQGLVYHPRGLHGYDHEHPLMRAIFVARGPAFPHPPNSQVEVFQNIEVYNILCDSIGLTPIPNNGTLRLPLSPVGQHKAEDMPEEPADPPAPNTLPAESAVSVPVPVASAASSSAKEEEPTKSIGVEPVQEPTPTEQPSSENDPDDEDGEVEKAEEGIKDFWDWFTGKVGEIWGKLTGDSSKDSSESEDSA